MNIHPFDWLSQHVVAWLSTLTAAGIYRWVMNVFKFRKLNAEIAQIKAGTAKTNAELAALKDAQDMQRLMNKLFEYRDLPEDGVCKTFPEENPEKIKEALTRLKRENSRLPIAPRGHR